MVYFNKWSETGRWPPAILYSGEDDCDGYLDIKSDDEAYTNKRRDGAVEGDEERVCSYWNKHRDRE